MISPPSLPVAYSVVLCHRSIRLAPLWTQGRCKNVLAKAEFVGYASGRLIALSSRRLNWRRRGALPLRQAHDTLRPADGGVSATPREQEPRLLERLRWQEVLTPIRIRRHNNSWHETQVTGAKGLIAALADGSTACYTGSKPKFGILCGSI